MPVIYLEDVLDNVGNKYLAVNVAAQRARQLNEKGISMLMSTAQKPVSLALQELSEDKIGYEELDQPIETTEEFPFSPTDEDEEDSEVLEELQPTQEYYDDSNFSDPDEPEEGL